MNREDEIRTLEQNKRLHAMVADLSRQVPWAGGLMDEESWKRLLLGAVYDQRMVPNPIYPTKPFVVINKRTSSGLVVPEMSAFLSEIQVFGDERGVRWGDQ